MAKERGLTPVERGWRDQQDGLKITQCPFAKGTARFKWQRGWYASLNGIAFNALPD